MVLLKKIGVTILAVYAVLFALSFIMWPVRNVWYGFIDNQPELFVVILIVGIAGVILGGGGEHHK